MIASAAKVQSTVYSTMLVNILTSFLNNEESRIEYIDSVENCSRAEGGNHTIVKLCEFDGQRFVIEESDSADDKVYIDDDNDIINTKFRELRREVLQERIEKMTSEYYFLQNKYDESNRTIYVMSKENFGKIAVAKTYDDAGQEVGHETSGDIHPENSYSFLGEALGKIVRENAENFDFIDDEELVKFTELNKDEIVLNKITGYNYWDGHNNKTISIGSSTFGDGDSSHEEVDNPELYAEILLLSFAKESKQNFGHKERTVEYDDTTDYLVMSDIQYQDSPEIYRISEV